LPEEQFVFGRVACKSTSQNAVAFLLSGDTRIKIVGVSRKITALKSLSENGIIFSTAANRETFYRKGKIKKIFQPVVAINKAISC